MKTLELNTDFLGEEYTLKCALQWYIKHQETALKDLKIIYGKGFIPNQHIYITHIKNCKSLLKKL